MARTLDERGVKALERISNSLQNLDNYAKQLDVHEDILNVPPTDGLWEDNRTDQDQLKASYKELEECMKYNTGSGIDVYNRFRIQNMHKMTPIPVCRFIDEKLKRFERI